MSKNFDRWVVLNEARKEAYMNPPKVEKPKPLGNCIYFIQDGEAIKIGCTWAAGPMYRIKALQVGNPRELVLVGFYQGSDEKDLHRRFAPHWIRGEWFRDNPELRELIAAKCPANDA